MEIDSGHKFSILSSFKSKIFPKLFHFLSFELFAWKSILRSKNSITRGSRWRIGNEKTICIFEDSWLLNLEGGRIVTPPTLLSREATMDCLINLHSGWWNTHLIDLCFYPPKAKLIKSLPLCSTFQPDTLIWPKENLGNYLVKTGYKFLCDTPDVDLIDSEEAMAQRQF